MSSALSYCRCTSEHKWAQVGTSRQATFTRYTWSLDFFFTINEIFKEFQGGVIVLDSTHSTSVASKIVSLCHFSAYVKSRIAPQNRQSVPDTSNIGPLGALPIKSTIFEASPRPLTRFSKFRQIPNMFVKNW